MKRLTLDLEPALHRQLKLLAVESGKPIVEMIREWIKDHLPKPKK